MKLFHNKSQRNTFIVFTVVMAVADMAWRDWGSFDPRNYGFWLAVGKSLLFNLFFNWIMKYQNPTKKKDNEIDEG